MNEDVGGMAVIFGSSQVVQNFVQHIFPKKFMAGQPTPP